MYKGINAKVLREEIVNDKGLYDVVLSYEYLRSVCYKELSEQTYNACIEVAHNLDSLLRTVINNDNNNVVVCRTYKGYVWILELNYLDDGEETFVVENWPSIDELKDEGCDNLVGESVPIEGLNNIIEYMHQDNEEENNEALDDFLAELDESTFDALVEE